MAKVQFETYTPNEIVLFPSNLVRLFHLDIDCHGTIIAFSPFYLFAQY